MLTTVGYRIQIYQSIPLHQPHTNKHITYARKKETNLQRIPRMRQISISLLTATGATGDNFFHMRNHH